MFVMLAFAPVAYGDGPPARTASELQNVGAPSNSAEPAQTEKPAAQTEPRTPAAPSEPTTEPQKSAAPADSTAPAATPAGSTPPGAATNVGDPRSVFFVQRNKNRNEVHYGITLDADCRPAGKEPVYNYWLRLEKGPDVTEPLTFLQQRGYGFATQKVGGDFVTAVLRAIPHRSIRFVAHRADGSCRADAYIAIAGEPAHLDRVYVFAEEGLVLPDVKYIELFGHGGDGKEVHERIEPD